MLDRRALQLGADLIEHGGTLIALDAGELDLDEFVGGQAAVDFLYYRFAQALAGDGDERMQVVGGGAQFAALYWSQFNHGGILTR